MKDETRSSIVVGSTILFAFLIPFLILFSFKIPFLAIPFFISLSFFIILGGCIGGYLVLWKLAQLNEKILVLRKFEFKVEDRLEIPSLKIMAIMGGFFVIRAIIILQMWNPIFQFILVWLFDFLTDALILYNKKRRFFILIDSFIDVVTRLVIFLPYFTYIFVPIFFMLWAGVKIFTNFLPELAFVKGLIPDMLYYYAFLGSYLIIFSAIASYITNFLIFTFDSEEIEKIF
jgi:hypothetical protein